MNPGRGLELITPSGRMPEDSCSQACVMRCCVLLLLLNKRFCTCLTQLITHPLQDIYCKLLNWRSSNSFALLNSRLFICSHQNTVQNPATFCGLWKLPERFVELVCWSLSAD